jgi:hypothetical protein
MEQLEGRFADKLASLEKSLEEKYQKEIADLKVPPVGRFCSKLTC